MDRIYSPRLDRSITTVIRECGKCKNFGPTHLHSLLEPIVRRHPFELLVSDYLSMPTGKGGHHMIVLFIDTFSQYTWGYMLKTHGTAKTTVDGLDKIRHNFRAPESLMTDGGKHFNNEEVRSWCSRNDTHHHVTAAYTPWINGLVEGTNGKLLGWLKCTCTPNLGEEAYADVKPDDVPKAWPEHFNAAIEHLNGWVLPAFQFSPKELLLGLVVNTPRMPTSRLSEPALPTETNVHTAYVAQQRLDAADHTVAHALKCKAIFDRRVHRSKAREVLFSPGQLVQVYANELDSTFKTSRKIIPQWSAPRRIATRRGNSYTLATLEGFPIPGFFHAHRLRHFYPRTNSLLADAEKEEMVARRAAMQNEDEGTGDEGRGNETMGEDKGESERTAGDAEDMVTPVADEPHKLSLLELDTPLRMHDLECRICAGGICSGNLEQGSRETEDRTEDRTESGQGQEECQGS
jgi:transposase InsO family protein